MIFDFSFILVAATALTGVIWGLDSWLFKPQRVAAAQTTAAGGAAPEGVREPIVVEYARSFFPVILIVLLIRSFLFEPFRIPSDSMTPTSARTVPSKLAASTKVAVMPLTRLAPERLCTTRRPARVRPQT